MRPVRQDLAAGQTLLNAETVMRCGCMLANTSCLSSCLCCILWVTVAEVEFCRSIDRGIPRPPFYADWPLPRTCRARQPAAFRAQFEPGRTGCPYHASLSQPSPPPSSRPLLTAACLLWPVHLHTKQEAFSGILLRRFASFYTESTRTRTSR